MTALAREDIEKIAHLARLTLEESQIEQYTNSMSKILDLISLINEADTTTISPMAHPFESLTQPLREDVVTETNQRERFLSIAPETEAGLFLVPEVIASE